MKDIQYRKRIKINGIYTYFDSILTEKENNKKRQVKINLLGSHVKQTFKCVICLKLVIVRQKSIKNLHLCKLCKQDPKKTYYINHRIASLKRWDPPKEYDLTFEKLWKLKLDNCQYCGKSATKENTNGIDRVDSKIGYVIENCVSCCYTCNIMKHAFSIEYFLSHIEKIYKYNLDVVKIKLFTRKVSYVRLGADGKGE